MKVSAKSQQANPRHRSFKIVKMRFSQLATAVAVIFASQAVASPLEKRVTVQSYSTITSPVDGTPMAAGETFPFNFALSNWCETGYSPFSVYVLDSKPTASSLNATQGFTSYLYFFGTYLVDNFPRAWLATCSLLLILTVCFHASEGLPQMGTPPPTSLTMPTLGAEYSGQEVFLAVVQTERDCPVSCARFMPSQDLTLLL